MASKGQLIQWYRRRVPSQVTVVSGAGDIDLSKEDRILSLGDVGKAIEVKPESENITISSGDSGIRLSPEDRQIEVSE